MNHSPNMLGFRHYGRPRVRRLLGAALAGAGTGIVAQAQAKRQDTLLRLRRQWQKEDQASSAALTREGWDRQDARTAEGRAATEALTREGWERADVRAEEGRAHEISMLDRKLAEKRALPPKPTAEQQNIAAFLQRNPGKTEADYFAMKRAPGATVNVHPDDKPRSISAMFDPSTRMEPSKGHIFDFDPATKTIRRDERGIPIEVPRGKTAKELEEAEAKEAGRTESAQAQANLAVTHIDAVRKIMRESPLPTTGMVGSLLSRFEGSDAHDMNRRLDSLKAMVGFNALQEMRANSPTGGALGQVSEMELALLQSTIASLEQSQSKEQFLENLKLVENAFNEVIHGPQPGGPDRDVSPLQPAPDVTLPPPVAPAPAGPPEPVAPIAALAPLVNGGRAASVSRAAPETVPDPSLAPTPAAPVNGARNGGRNGGRKGPPKPEAPPGSEALTADEAERVSMYADLPPDALQRQVETMAANPNQYSDAEKRAAAIAWERAFGGN